jgi:hypothetical protein
MNLELKIGLIRYGGGSQVAAAKKLNIPESKLSHLVRGHVEPNERERDLLKKALGADYFQNEKQPPSAA